MEKTKILIVEDEAVIAMEIESQLKALGYEITSMVNNGADAIKKAECSWYSFPPRSQRINGFI